MSDQYKQALTRAKAIAADLFQAYCDDTEDSGELDFLVGVTPEDLAEDFGKWLGDNTVIDWVGKHINRR